MAGAVILNMHPDDPLPSASKANSRSRVRSTRSSHSTSIEESTPLLSRQEEQDLQEEEELEVANGDITSSRASTYSSSSLRQRTKPARRLPTVLALVTLITVICVALSAGFLLPAAVEEYANQAVVVKPTYLSIENFSENGLFARFRGELSMNASRVDKSVIRNVGRLATWIAHKVETRPTTVEATLPEYGGLLLGTANIPQFVIDIRNGHKNQVDFVAELAPGEYKTVRKLANDWLENRLGQIRIKGSAKIGMKSGVIPLGVQSISESLIFEGYNLYNHFPAHKSAHRLQS